MRRLTLSRRARWAVPAGALAVVAAVGAGAVAVTSAQASPVLPARTSAQLLAAVTGRTGAVPAFTGTVVETAVLGLPDLPGMDDLGSVTSLLTGSHTVNIWYASPRHLRISVPQTMSESDLFVDGNTAWSWDSSGNTVTRYLLPARTGQLPPMPTVTPQQAARQALAAVGPTTRVTLQRNVMVADQAAYQLVLAPKSAQSLVGQVRIAVDGSHDIPLRVQVFARGATSPAFQVGFTSISFVRPAAANLAFTPPPGATVTTQKLTGQDLSGSVMRGRALRDEPKTFGTSWLTVAEVSSADLSAALGDMSGLQIQVTIGPEKKFSSGGMFGSSSKQAVGNAASSAARAVAGAGPGGGPGGIGTFGLFGLAMQSARPVHGSWGSGRLLRTSLLSVLMTSDGRVFLGAVTPAVLYHDAAQGR